MTGRAIDLPAAPDAGEAGFLVREILSTGRERQVALRDGRRYAARLDRLPAPAWPDCYAVRSASPGRLDALGLREMAMPPCGETQVLVRVRATGLNLRDVLRALGMLDRDAAGPTRFGLEVAGVIEAVGGRVSGFAIGDAVVAVMTEQGLASHVAVESRFARRLPSGLGFRDAAALPLATLTALHALERLGGVHAGQHVLIHAAAGGVGQAAVRIAHRAGATVIGTASPSKWAYLRRSGVVHVASSRDLDFVDVVRDATGGRGADIVLNALNGPFIPAGLAACAPGGMFVEIGSIGAWTDAEVAACRPDVRYARFDLKQVAERDPEGFAALFDGIMRRVAEGEMAPSPTTAFPVDQTEAAMRHMAQAQHVGKIVITHPGPVQVRADAAYVVAGGLSALGGAVARRLAGMGAGRVVVLSRGPASPSADPVIRSASCDITDAVAVARLFADLRDEGLRVAGVVHAAGVLDDGLLATQSPDAIRRVLAPKVAGTWHLHQATAHLALDFFVLFSSVAALLDAPGQAAYAGANAFQDALAHHRRGTGLPALSINWGPWARIGMAERLDALAKGRIEALGLHLLPPDTALQAFADVLPHQGQVALVAADWPRLARAADRAESAGDAPRHEPSVSTRPDGPPSGERTRRLRDVVAREVRAVLAMAPHDDVSVDEKLFDLGLDSLLAVELRNRLEGALGRRLSATLVFNHPTIAALAAHLDPDPNRPDPEGQPVSDGDDQLRAHVDAMTDEEAERELRADIDRVHDRRDIEV